MLFWLGTHKPCWLDRTAAPLFLSYRRLIEVVRPRRSAGAWALDSGGFSELSINGHWSISAQRYAADAVRWAESIGGLAWAAIQDWMCEPHILAKTGGTVRDHQARTIESWHALRCAVPGVPWVPVLQGWHLEDYLRHAEDYRVSGVDLAALRLVGVGSICRRQGTKEAERIIRALSALGIRLHGFGFKTEGIRRCWGALASADSMAWSMDARRRGQPLPGCPHATCANCLRYALRWRERLLQLPEG
jgi:hypothetical protein